MKTRVVTIKTASVLVLLMATATFGQTHVQPGQVSVNANSPAAKIAGPLQISLKNPGAQITASREWQTTGPFAGAEAQFQSSETPFVSDVTFPVATLLRGHIQMQGFHRVSSNENFYLGLPGGGTLPAWNVTLTSHPAQWSRATVESDGFAIAFHTHGSRAPEPALQVLRKISRFAESAYRN
jgi:hypothetical protein